MSRAITCTCGVAHADPLALVCCGTYDHGHGLFALVNCPACGTTFSATIAPSQKDELDARGLAHRRANEQLLEQIWSRKPVCGG